MFERERARHPVAGLADAVEAEPVGVDVVAGEEEVGDGGEHLLPVGPERDVALEQHGLLAGAFEHHDVVAAFQGAFGSFAPPPVMASSLPRFITRVGRTEPEASGRKSQPGMAVPSYGMSMRSTGQRVLATKPSHAARWARKVGRSRSALSRPSTALTATAK
jgi:hypothetical protein